MTVSLLHILQSLFSPLFTGTLSSRSCENGYEPSLDKLRCDDGVLSPSTFECVEMCRAPNPIKYIKPGSIKFESMSRSTGGFACEEGEFISLNSNCTTRCKSGYASDTTLLSCSLSNEGKPELAPRGFVCSQLVPMECRVETDIPSHCFPPCLSNDATPDDVIGLKSSGGKCGGDLKNIASGSTCTSNCQDGFESTVETLQCVAGPTIYTDSSLKPDGGYRCVEKCSLPSIMDLGSSAKIMSFEGCGLIDSDFDATGALTLGGGKMKRGKVCKLNCISGYEPYKGSSNLFTCEADGSTDYSRFVAWGTIEPEYVFRCTEKLCNSQELLSVVPGDRAVEMKCLSTSTVSIDDAQTALMQPGEACTPQCISGFEPNVEGDLKCYTGMLYDKSGRQVSIFSCDPMNCDVPNSIINAHDEFACKESNETIPAGTDCTPQCKDAYEPSVSVLSCPTQGGGILEPSVFECLPGPCPIQSENYMWVCSDGAISLKHGENCTVRCPNGYTSSILTAQCHISELVEDPICVPNPCPQPTGIISMSTSGPCVGLGQNDLIASGSSCETQCQEGYVSTVSTLKCNAGVVTPYTFKCVGLRSSGCLQSIDVTYGNYNRLFDFQIPETNEVASAFECMDLCKSYPYFVLSNRGTCQCLWNPNSAVEYDVGTECGSWCYDDEASGSNFPCGTDSKYALYVTLNHLSLSLLCVCVCVRAPSLSRSPSSSSS